MSKALILEKEKEEMLAKASKISSFYPGCTIKVITRDPITNKQLPPFEGICIAASHKGITSSVTIRKIGDKNVGMEKTFFLYAPTFDSLETIKRGKVRRAKLFYLRDIRGTMRIKEKMDYSKSKPKKH